jgi:glycosyltransferase involved in cell wall biosynthesis
VKVSIVVPSFNQAEFLEEALDSLVNQTYPEIEIIVMDGGSTDGSVDVIRRFADRIAYWQSQADGGQAAAIHAGFQMAQGEVLGWLNSDDFLDKGAIARVVEAFSINPDSRWLYGNSTIVDISSKLITSRVVVPVDIYDLVNCSYYIPQESTFFYRDLYFTVGGIDATLRYALDYDLWLRFADYSPPLYLNKYLGCFRYSPQQKSAQLLKYFAEERTVKQKYNRYQLHPAIAFALKVRLSTFIVIRRLQSNSLKNHLVYLNKLLNNQGPNLGLVAWRSTILLSLGVLLTLLIAALAFFYFRSVF